MENVITEITTILECFGSLAGIAVLCSIISGYIITWCKVKSENRQWTSWLVSVCITAVAVLLGVYCDFGVFVSFDVASWTSWVYAVVTAILGGLLSNGIYDINMVQKILDWIGAFPKMNNTETENKDKA